MSGERIRTGSAKILRTKLSNPTATNLQRLTTAHSFFAEKAQGNGKRLVAAENGHNPTGSGYRQLGRILKIHEGSLHPIIKDEQCSFIIYLFNYLFTVLD